VAVHSEALRPRGIPREMLARHRPARATAFGPEESIMEHTGISGCALQRPASVPVLRSIGSSRQAAASPVIGTFGLF
jgi:hypothetical protein